jgi:hypothetical protein
VKREANDLGKEKTGSKDAARLVGGGRENRRLGWTRSTRSTEGNSCHTQTCRKWVGSMRTGSTPPGPFLRSQGTCSRATASVTAVQDLSWFMVLYLLKENRALKASPYKKKNPLRCQLANPKVWDTPKLTLCMREYNVAWFEYYILVLKYRHFLVSSVVYFTFSQRSTKYSRKQFHVNKILHSRIFYFLHLNTSRIVYTL